MKILFDHQAFTLQNYGGISRYFAELIKNSVADIQIIPCIPFSSNLYLKDLKIPTKTFLENKKFKGKLSMLRKLNNFKTKKILKQQQFDLLHPGYYDPYFFKNLNKKPFVLTVHDMTHELYPEMFSKFDKTAQWKKFLIEKSNHIIAVSNNTKKDILKFTDISASKISVVWHGFYQNIKQPATILDFPKCFLLFVGGRIGYKNFSNFIKAFALLHKDFPELQLVCTGNSFTESEKKQFENLKISQAVHQIRATDNELTWLYQQAKAFVFPSLYEGFGIPILEAFANNCPVILSNTGAVKEVAAEAAMYFNPNEVIDIKEVITKVLNDENLQKVMVKRGNQRLKLFSWKKTANETALVYHKILNK